MGLPAPGFNPLTGISSILTMFDKTPEELLEFCFNPLTGISSILTTDNSGGQPRADHRFNPLTGISSILTQGEYDEFLRPVSVSIP